MHPTMKATAKTRIISHRNPGRCHLVPKPSISLSVSAGPVGEGEAGGEGGCIGGEGGEGLAGGGGGGEGAEEAHAPRRTTS